MTDSKKENVFTENNELAEYAPDQWWLEELLAHAGEGKVSPDTRRAARVAVNFVNLAACEPEDYTYRFRFFQTPMHTHHRHCGWGDWEYCDEQKYNEILYYIKEMDCAYQAQKIPMRPIEDTCIDLKNKGWHEPKYRVVNQEDGSTVPIRKAAISAMRAAALENDAWVNFEVSLDNGESWQHL